MRLHCLICAFSAALAAATAQRADAAGATASSATNRSLPASGTPSPLPSFQPVIVHSHFGGQIFGFDIDANGTEGVLSEAQDVSGGNVLAAVETFDQRTGEIIRVVAKTTTQDDFLTLGVVGQHVGLVELEHEVSFLHIQRSYPLVNPLSADRFTARWTPPIDNDHIIEEVSRNQGPGTVAAVYAYDNSENFRPQVFVTDVATNTFGPLIVLTDSSFQTGLVPKLAYNPSTNKAVLGIQTIGNPFIAPTFALVELQSGDITMFDGVGTGDVNGLAVDPVTNIACSTTEIDFSVQFYDLSTLIGFSQPLPGANNQFNSGADVAVDPIHHLFLVAQPNSTTDPGASSIHVYDESGDLIESLDGFHFSNTFNVIPMHIALHPSLRYGFVDGPDPGVTEIQSFAY